MAKQFDGGIPQFGQKGFDVLSSATSPGTEEYYWITCLADATVTVTSDQGDNLTTQAILAGTSFAVSATVVEETAGGVVIAYRK